ncbi:MAG: COG1470 family protein [Armatimonadota bacterium]
MHRALSGLIVLLLLCGLAVSAAKAPVKTASKPWWTTLAAPADANLDAIIGADARLRWEVTGGASEKDGGPYALENDPILGRSVLVCGKSPITLQSRGTYQNVEISYLARVVTTDKVTSASAGFTLRGDDPAKSTVVNLVGAYNGNLTIGITMNALTPAVAINQAYDLRAYDTVMPTWPNAVRAPVEKDMSALPLSQDKWVRVRYQLSDARTRIWVDDRLLVDKAKYPQTRGQVQLALQPGSRLAELSVRPLPAASLYEPIGLDGYARNRALLGTAAIADTALPFGKLVNVDGVPFRFADRKSKTDPDHLDIGRSLVRQGALDGYFPTYEARYSGSFTVDPARLQLRIPNGRYDAMYVVAGFDGDKNNVPLLSALFYRPGAGYAQSFETKVPGLTAKTADAKPLPVTLENGKKVNLWLVKIPLDPAKLASFSDMDTLEVELTKQVRQYRSYPDPYLYGWHGAGLPSGVQVYAVTFHKPEVEYSVDPTAFGHVWTTPGVPEYNVTLANNTAKEKTLALITKSTSYDNSEVIPQEQSVTLKPNETKKVNVKFAVTKNGIHTLNVTLKDGAQSWTEERNFCRLAKDTRAPVWTKDQGPLFGFWAYGSGHYGPSWVDTAKVMKLAGARTSIASSADPKTPEGQFLIANKWPLAGNAWPIGPQWDWAGAEPLDMAKYNAFKETALKAFRDAQGDNPEYVTFFPEPHISMELTAGAGPADYWGEEYKLTEQEKLGLRVFYNTSKSAAESIRAAWPNTKILIPWGDPLFAVALLRAGFPKELTDGSGLDMIGFERLPEQQLHQQSTHRLYILKNEYAKAGIPDPELYYIEGTFSPTEVGALTWQEQAERYHRWTLISLAYGVDRFYSGWFAFDCGDYYGAEHYGGCGIQRRIPYLDPKPAYSHYATMTRMLERSKFDKWLPTGSNTVYCLKFMRPSWTRPGQQESVYALWSVRGTRPVTVTLAADATINVIDGMDNAAPVKSAGGKATFTVGESPVYVTGAGDIAAIALGKPDHSDAVTWARTRNQATWHDGPAVKKPPVTKELTLANFGDGTWTNVAERDEIYETNNFDTKRFLGKMSAKVTADAERQGKFLAVRLEKQDKERKLMPFYTVLKPKAPITIPGKACALGVWVKANSDWGRVVYSLRDAKGERWMSIGTKDQWNCDDVHSWVQFNFDGWRYLRFELPSNSEYDAYREFGSTWWGNYGGDNIVDLPLKLEKVIVERRTHVLYVNDIQPANPADVLLGELIAEYETPFDATPQAVALNKVRMALPAAVSLPNPITEMANNVPAPVTLKGVRPPDWGYDGTTALVDFTTTDDATGYNVWVAAYPDGRGAIKLPWTLTKPGGQIYWLRPAMKLYLWVTYTTKDGKVSKPSNRLEIQLVDAFANK